MMKTPALQTMIEDRKEATFSQMKELLDIYPAEAKRVSLNVTLARRPFCKFGHCI